MVKDMAPEILTLTDENLPEWKLTRAKAIVTVLLETKPPFDPVLLLKVLGIDPNSDQYAPSKYQSNGLRKER